MKNASVSIYLQMSAYIMKRFDIVCSNAYATNV